MIQSFGAEMADGQHFVFRANHRAWDEAERVAGTGLVDFLTGLAGTRAMTPHYRLLWALSATHRAAIGLVDFEGFLDLLPMGPAWDALLGKAYGLLGDVFGQGGAAAPPASMTTTS